jgi:hypothetical protein
MVVNSSEILKPDAKILELWKKQIDTNFNLTNTDVLIAYLMHVMFIIGIKMDYKQFYLHYPNYNEFERILSSSARDGLFSSICVLKTGHYLYPDNELKINRKILDEMLFSHSKPFVFNFNKTM